MISLPYLSLLSLETNEVEGETQMMLMKELFWKAGGTGGANRLKKNHSVGL